MDHFLLILKIGLLIWIIFNFFFTKSEAKALEEKKAKLLSVRRDTDLTEDERLAILKLLEFDVDAKEVYYITDHFELHSMPDEEAEGQKRLFMAICDYVVAMPENAFYYLDEEEMMAEVVVSNDVMFVVRLNDYTIVDDLNDTLTQPANTQANTEQVTHEFTSQQPNSDRTKTTLSNKEQNTGELYQAVNVETHSNESIESTSPTKPKTVLKSERQATLTEAQYLSPSSFRILIATLIVVATVIFSHIQTFDLAIEPTWLPAATLATVCIIALLLLKKDTTKLNPTRLTVKRYFGKIDAIETSANISWILFTDPNGETSKAWIPNRWQNTINLTREVYFEVEPTHSAALRVDLNEISEQDLAKKKPKYLFAALGLLISIAIIANNTQFSWRDASIAILQHSESHHISNVDDWSTLDLKVGDTISINQPRLCIDGYDEQYNPVYCQSFFYPLTNEAFNVLPDTTFVESYRRFITQQPDYFPQITEGLYSYLSTLFLLKQQSSDDLYNKTIRPRKELMMFNVANLRAIANHLAPYCPENRKTTTVKLTETENAIAENCQNFKAEFSILWRETTSSECENSCWNEALQEREFDDDETIKNIDELTQYKMSLNQLQDAIWQQTRESLHVARPNQAYIVVNWNETDHADLYQITRLRAELKHDYLSGKVELLDELIPLQTEMAQQSIQGTILEIYADGGPVRISLAPPISHQQALENIIEHALMALFGVLALLMLLSYRSNSRKSKPRKEKRDNTRGAWIS